MKKLIFFSFICYLCFFSCSKDYEIEENKIQELRLDNQDSKKVASLISNLLDDQNVYSILIEELNKEWGDDFQVPLNGFLEYLQKDIVNLKSDHIVNELLEITNKYRSLTLLTTENNIDKYLNNVEKPTIFIAPSSDGEKSIYGITPELNYVLTDARVEPEFPFLVLGYCETCDSNGEQLDLFSNIEKSDDLDLRSTRVSGRQEYVTYIKTPNLSSIESWYFGKPELRFVAVLGSGTTAKKAFDTQFKPKRSQAKNGYSLNDPMFYWYFDNSVGYNNGPDYYLQTIEVDNSGATQKLQIGTSVIIAEGVEFKTVSYEITYKKEDKLLFGRLINYPDPSPGVFTSGDLLHTTITNKN